MDEGSKQSPDLAAVAAEWAQTLAAHWTERAGSEVRLQVTAVERIEVAAPQAGEEGGAAAHASCRLRGDADTVAAHLLAPVVDAVAIAALLRGEGPEQIQERVTQEADAESLEAFGGAMGDAAGALSRLLEAAGLAALEAGDASRLEAPVPEAGALPQGAYRRARCGLAVKGRPEGRLDLLVPEALAAEWFGAAPASRARAGRAEPGGPVFLLEPDPSDCERAAALGDELGCAVQAAAGRELPEDWMDSVAAASAAVVAWDLGGRPGLDVLETLVHDHRTRNVPVYMCAKAPTRAVVEAAMRAGATGFLLRPYGAEDLRGCLLGGAAVPRDTVE